METIRRELAAVPDIRQSAIENFLKRYPDGHLAQIHPVIKASNDEEREVLHLISSSSVDRAHDVVEPKGGQFDNYLKNPVVLVDHSYTVETIIGEAKRLEVQGTDVWSRTRFLDTDRAEASFNLTKEGLGGWSIGFRPLDGHSVREGNKLKCKSCAKRYEEQVKEADPDEYSWVRGHHFMTWELLEYSHVAVPMNADAVGRVVARGLVPEALARDFFDTGEAPAPKTEQKSDPPAEAAGDSPNAETPVPIEVNPALARHFARAERRLRIGAVERSIRDALRKVGIE